MHVVLLLLRESWSLTRLRIPWQTGATKLYVSFGSGGEAGSLFRPRRQFHVGYELPHKGAAGGGTTEVVWLSKLMSDCSWCLVAVVILDQCSRVGLGRASL